MAQITLKGAESFDLRDVQAGESGTFFSFHGGQSAGRYGGDDAVPSELSSNVLGNQVGDLRRVFAVSHFDHNQHAGFVGEGVLGFDHGRWFESAQKGKHRTPRQHGAR